MYKKNEVEFIVKKGFRTLSDEIHDFFNHGIPMKNMSVPENIPEGTAPLALEATRGVETCDVYLASKAAHRRMKAARKEGERFIKGRRFKS